ncbi:putative 28S rRNA (cytosine-C(5))-methyltransferase [Smittium mucronatum]|uniref:Putative 28S rRNA (Cytosine-C(5))-methyltransferase n=1 Tax=Smittium mucronatum TaxID=133383 RepID=A0A1R0H3L4_9FUNG|nr:putative 28S rRNA (cytosine-C(5))-methyltransferase [Smittium mucronatum]
MHHKKDDYYIKSRILNNKDRILEEYKLSLSIPKFKEIAEPTEKKTDSLLVFPPLTDLHENELYLNGSLILQDKASCFPAAILDPAAGSVVIDACAAPGNKTSHLSMLMANSGSIVACDLDSSRLKTLVQQTNLAGCKNIEAKNQSFLDIDPSSKFGKSVQYILLDPSCSGSGMANKSEDLVDSFIDSYFNRNKSCSIKTRPFRKVTVDRLEDLSAFQIEMLNHAMKFENVVAITYSTCSVHSIENENVVKMALLDNPDFALAARSHVLPTWPMRGIPNTIDPSDADLNKEELESVIRSNTQDMFTNGFFVALFVNLRKNVAYQTVSNHLRSQFVAESGSTAVDAASTLPPLSTSQSEGIDKSLPSGHKRPISDTTDPTSKKNKKRNRTKKGSRAAITS